MSLVNDVLKDLNRRSQQESHAMPIQALQLDASNNPRFYSGFNTGKILLVIGLILSLIVIAQLIINKPISHLFSKPVLASNEVNSDFIDMPSADASLVEKKSAELKLLDNTSDEKIVEIAVYESVSVPLQKDTENLIPAAVKSLAPSLKKVKTVNSKESSDQNRVNKDVVSFEEPEEPKILKVKIPGLVEYQLALKAYKEKRFELAMNWIDIALAEQVKPDYQLLKARIYIQSKDASGLYEYVLDHSHVANLEWFKLIAPGLQIFGYHQLSNKYYQTLIKKYPEQVKYQFALALNYSRLGEYNKTYRIYQDLSLSQQMTKKQKRWLTAQLSRLDSKKAAQHGS